MKFLFFAPIAVLADANLLARFIGQKDATKGFADFVSRRVGDLSTVATRLDALANIAVHIKQKITKNTDDFLGINTTPSHILAQLDGLPLTIRSQIEILCPTHFEDAMTPCAQVVDATSTWSTHYLCNKYAGGLNPSQAVEYGVCIDFLPTAPMI